MLRRILPLLLLACVFTPAAAQTTRYVTDEFEVTMRSGTSTANSIVRMLRSGQAVTVLEEDLASQYSLVETPDGKQGYVLTRFLIDSPAAKQQLAELTERYESQQELVAQQQSEIAALQQSLEQARSDNQSLKTTLRASEQELARVQDAAQNALTILDQNKQLQASVAQLQTEQARLSQENAELRDTTRLDWFVRGGAVSLVAFLIGIIVTRIRWRKRDSWGSY